MRTMRTMLYGLQLILLCFAVINHAAADESFEATKKAAERGDANAQFFLGDMYDNGRGVSENDAEAVKWYRKAADQGLAEAQLLLGGMYYIGKGVPKDDAEAVKWARKAADQGWGFAQYELGMMHLMGEGVQKNYIQVRIAFNR